MDSSCRNCFLRNFLLEVAHASALFDPQAGKGFWWEKCLLHLFSNASLSSKLFSTRVCFTQFSPHQADFLASVRAKLTSERRRGFDLLRAKPATPQWPVAHCCSTAEGLPTRPRFNVPFVGPKMDARSTLLGHVCSRSLPLRGNSS